jgi:hypothetical protein
MRSASPVTLDSRLRERTGRSRFNTTRSSHPPGLNEAVNLVLHRAEMGGDAVLLWCRPRAAIVQSVLPLNSIMPGGSGG